MKDAKWKDVQIFKCNCGAETFLSCYAIEWCDELREFSITLHDEPFTFWQKLRYLFKPDKRTHEILLTEDNVRDIVKQMKTYLKGVKK